MMKGKGGLTAPLKATTLHLIGENIYFVWNEHQNEHLGEHQNEGGAAWTLSRLSG